MNHRPSIMRLVKSRISKFNRIKRSKSLHLLRRSMPVLKMGRIKCHSEDHKLRWQISTFLKSHQPQSTLVSTNQKPMLYDTRRTINRIKKALIKTLAIGNSSRFPLPAISSPQTLVLLLFVKTGTRFWPQGYLSMKER